MHLNNCHWWNISCQCWAYFSQILAYLVLQCSFLAFVNSKVPWILPQWPVNLPRVAIEFAGSGQRMLPQWPVICPSGHWLPTILVHCFHIYIGTSRKSGIDMIEFPLMTNYCSSLYESALLLSFCLILAAICLPVQNISYKFWSLHCPYTLIAVLLF